MTPAERALAMEQVVVRLKRGDDLSMSGRTLLIEWFDNLPSMHLRVMRASEAIALLAMTVDRASELIDNPGWKGQADTAISVGSAALVGLGEAAKDETHGVVWARLVDRALGRQ